jgi:hypothetical protein
MGWLLVGGRLGGAWSDTDWHYDNHNWFNTIGPALVGTNFDIDASGILGGGQAGFNYQTGAWVIGIEGSVAAADLDESRKSPFFPTSDTYTAEVNWLTTATGRIGYAQDKWLAYAKGGWAGADVELTLFDHGTPVRASSSDWANGWTVGGGAEYALLQELLARRRVRLCRSRQRPLEDQLPDLSLRRGRRRARRRRRHQGPVGHGAAQLPLRRLGGLLRPEHAGENRVHVLRMIGEIELGADLVGVERLGHVLVGE